MVEVMIEEMFGSDRSRPRDYRRAVVIDTGPQNTTNEDTLRSERRSALKKRLTQPTLLEMSGNATNSLLKKDLERAAVSTVRHCCSRKANKNRGSSSLRCSEWRAKTVFQQAANQELGCLSRIFVQEKPVRSFNN